MRTAPLALGNDPDDLDTDPPERSGRHLFLAVIIMALGALALLAIPVVAAAIVIGAIWVVASAPKAGVIKLAMGAIVAASVVGWYALRFLWVRLSPPEGIEISAESAPTLAATIDQVRDSLRCPALDGVVLTSQGYVVLALVPRLGLLGWNRAYLVVGMPCLQGLSTAEFKGLLARALYPLSPDCGRARATVHDVRETLEFLMEAQPDHINPVGGFLLRRFWPLFQPHAVQVSRAMQLAADQRAAHVAGTEAVASGLLRLPVLGAITSHYWSTVLRPRAERQAAPPPDISSEMGALLRGTPAVEISSPALRDAFVHETQPNESVPSLVDRLCALDSLPAEVERGQVPERPPPIAGRIAADELLGPKQRVLTDKLNALWFEGLRPVWECMHASAKGLRQRAAELPGVDTPGATVERLWQHAEILSSLEDHAHALPIARRVLEMQPDHVGASLLVAEALLDQCDEAGVALVQHAVRLDPTTAVRASASLATYYMRTGQASLIPGMMEETRATQHGVEKAVEAWQKVAHTDAFLPHSLDLATVLAVRETLARERDVASAYIVRKEIPGLPLTKGYLVALEIKPPLLSFRFDGDSTELVARLQQAVQLPGIAFVFSLKSRKKRAKLTAALAAVPDSRIYHRDGEPPRIPAAR